MDITQNDFMKGEPSNNHAFQILWRLHALHQSKSEHNWSMYWENFHSCAVIISPYLSNDLKIKLQEEYNKLGELIKHIKLTYDNEKTRENKILEARKTFAYTHEIFIVHALSNLDIIKKQVDGEIHFGQMDLEDVEKVVRQSRSIPDIERKLIDIKNKDDDDNDDDEESFIEKEIPKEVEEEIEEVGT